ncbi:uncharacterized protein LOC129226096 [Uloborus diversus]|uniref:uncharacterized protein LOC129226096 n=1 Tax=Uloborus diversus TaxID=327109 RepID=UPI002409662F|nr:uncharacterized protein LOC129226096 [Uloborus diversus]
MMANKTSLIQQLLKCGVFNVGNFILKSGISSPIYIDLRKVIQFPDVILGLSKAVRNKQIEANIESSVICGVPYTALPIASVYSVEYKIPMVMKRKEQKTYGTKKLVEGIFETRIKCLVIEDIVSSGMSVIETVDALRKEGLIVTDCIVIVDRKQGGCENLSEHGIKLYPLFSITDIFTEYCSINRIDDGLILKVNTYLEQNAHIQIETKSNSKPFGERAKHCNNPVLKKLFGIINKKKSNLCVAVDIVDCQQVLELAKLLGPHICVLKTHVDILKDFSKTFIAELTKTAQEFEFLLFEDRKFADIGNTVKHQYKDGMYAIQQWADIVTVHGIAGSGVIDALKSAVGNEARACILVAEMSTKGNLIDETYTKRIVEMGERNLDFVMGFISQHKLIEHDSLLHMCPGVGIHEEYDKLGQQYKSPEKAIEDGADVIIVGRGITQAVDVSKTAIEYKNRAYDAYLKYIAKETKV